MTKPEKLSNNLQARPVTTRQSDEIVKLANYYPIVALLIDSNNIMNECRPKKLTLVNTVQLIEEI